MAIEIQQVDLELDMGPKSCKSMMNLEKFNSFSQQKLTAQKLSEPSGLLLRLNVFGG